MGYRINGTDIRQLCETQDRVSGNLSIASFSNSSNFTLTNQKMTFGACYQLNLVGTGYGIANQNGLRGFKYRGNEYSAAKKYSRPGTTLRYTLLSTETKIYINHFDDCIYVSNYVDSRSGTRFSRTDFLHVFMQGAGGGGGASSGTKRSAGGGGGAFVGALVPLAATRDVWMVAGSRGMGGKSNGANGNTGNASKIMGGNGSTLSYVWEISANGGRYGGSAADGSGGTGGTYRISGISTAVYCKNGGKGGNVGSAGESVGGGALSFHMPESRTLGYNGGSGGNKPNQAGGGGASANGNGGSGGGVMSSGGGGGLYGAGGGGADNAWASFRSGGDGSDGFIKLYF